MKAALINFPNKSERVSPAFRLTLLGRDTLRPKNNLKGKFIGVEFTRIEWTAAVHH